jgi:glycosyltransferase involved in cell wall biosynthesis
MREPLVSILIPVYNAESWLAETIESALAQTWPRKEVIIVDDGSTDNSHAVTQKFVSRGIHVIRQSNQGAASARNVALLEAQGELIQYLDADDILAPDKIEQQARRLIGEPADAFATGAWARFYRRPSDASFAEHTDFHDYPSPVDWLIDAWNGRGTMPPASWLLPRSLAEKSGPWNEELSLSDDTEYVTRLVLNSSSLVFCPQSRAYYRSGNASLSARKDRKAHESYFLVCQLCSEQLLAHENTARTRKACASLWKFFAYQTYPAAPDLVRRAEAEANLLGGTDLKLEGRFILRLLSGVGGWKTARRLQAIYYRQRYSC